METFYLKRFPLWALPKNFSSFEDALLTKFVPQKKGSSLLKKRFLERFPGYRKELSQSIRRLILPKWRRKSVHLRRSFTKFVAKISVNCFKRVFFWKGFWVKGLSESSQNTNFIKLLGVNLFNLFFILILFVHFILFIFKTHFFVYLWAPLALNKTQFVAISDLHTQTVQSGVKWQVLRSSEPKLIS